MRRLLCSLALGAALTACDDEGPVTPADVVILPNQPRVFVGETEQLTATVVDEDGRMIESYPVSFRSSDVSVLTVSQGGLLSSVGPLGTSLITVSAGDVTAEVEATVVLGPSTLVLEPEFLDLVAGDRVQLEITVTDENGDVIPEPEVLFRTSDPAVVQVSLEGVVTAVGPGGAEITATSGGLARTIPVGVSAP